MPAATNRSICQTIRGLPATFSKGLGCVSVRGRMRSPRPAARIIAFIRRYILRLQGCRQVDLEYAIRGQIVGSVGQPDVGKHSRVVNDRDIDVYYRDKTNVKKRPTPADCVANSSIHKPGEILQNQD